MTDIEQVRENLTELKRVTPPGYSFYLVSRALAALDRVEAAGGTREQWGCANRDLCNCQGPSDCTVKATSPPPAALDRMEAAGICECGATRCRRGATCPLDTTVSG